ncbi:uncharacterized protein EI97DRAFT_433224 [Westerdykella ornata]|uniref:Peroxin 11C n=1 Tax=Westerdykella ornata TaxID=318751 RepID=A0A6A6JL23_WESOR|nr:uncharacterized protein EI97DRAFT_433224 [Westerdykella ornata]KAF2276386.1 hypothetical protein EI97DRAFT_433224 [Westerdykella ornata]
MTTPPSSANYEAPATSNTPAMAEEPHPPPSTTTAPDPALPTTTPSSSSSPSPPLSSSSSPEAPSSSAATPTHKTPRSTLQTLRILLLRTLHRLATKTDRTLTRLSTLLSTPRGIDVFLCTISYTLKFLSAAITKHLNRKLSTLAASVAQKADELLLLPGESFVATFPAPRRDAVLAKAAKSSQALYAVISDFRIFVRLWGLLGLYTWAKGEWKGADGAGAARQRKSWKERILKGITWAEIGSLVAFQVLENGAYLSSKKVLTSEAWAGEQGAARETKWWLWSCRFWAAYVVLEGARLGTLWYYAGEEDRALEADGEKEGKLVRERKRAEDRLWWRDILSNAGYFPLTLHWSVDGGLMGDMAVGLCGMLAGGANLLDAWQATA